MTSLFDTAIHLLESDHESARGEIQQSISRLENGSAGISTAESVLAVLRAGVEIARVLTNGATRENPQPQVVAYAQMISSLWAKINSVHLWDYRGVAILTILSFTAPNLNREDIRSQAATVRREMINRVNSHIRSEFGRDPESVHVVATLAKTLRVNSAYDPILDASHYRNVWAYLEELLGTAFRPAHFPVGSAELKRYQHLSSALAFKADGGLNLDEMRQSAVKAVATSCRVEGQKANPFSKPVHADSGSDSPKLANQRGADPSHVVSKSTARIYTVWYGTDRLPRQDISSPGFFNLRDPKELLHVGTCSVQIPKSHKFGSVGSSWLSRWPLVNSGALKLTGVQSLPSVDAFSASMRTALQKLSLDERVVVIYVHGYNTTFRAAAVRAAQIGFDLRVPGTMAFFSWPSRARKLGYFSDEATIANSEARFTEFVRTIASHTGAEQVNLISHSMGNRLTTHAIDAVKKSGVRLGKVILAAPDMDAQLFKNLATVYPLISDKTTMYVSNKDQAIRASRFLHGNPRAGLTPPVTIIPNIDTITVDNIDLTRIGHGYFAAAAPVLYDIKAIFDGKIQPHSRLRLSVAGPAGASYWALN